MSDNTEIEKTQLDTEKSQALVGNTKTTRARKWCFTLNNYTLEEKNNIMYWLKHKKHTKYIVGEEKGKNKTPHLQGYFNCKSAVSFYTLKNVNSRWHLEKAKGSDKQNFEYCSKESMYETNLCYDRKHKFLMRYNGVVWRDWQSDILDRISDKPNDREIIWVVDPIGDNGKSFLAKYIYLKYKCIIADGKKDNIFNQILKFYEEPNGEIEVVILDIPRHNENYVNYGMLEQIKNGLIYSGKYEGGDCIFDPPHIIVFSNFEPDINKFSQDRWTIINLNQDELGDI